jgi:hypothetical protein
VKFYHPGLVLAAFASACAVTTPASAARIELPEGFFSEILGFFRGAAREAEQGPKPKLQLETQKPQPTPAPDEQHSAQGSYPITTSADIGSIDPSRTLQSLHINDFQSNNDLVIFHSIRSAELRRLTRLRSSYHLQAVDSINDLNVRTRITNSLQYQNIYHVAAFAGRERQFGYVARTATIKWVRNEPLLNDLVNVKLCPACRVHASWKLGSSDSIDGIRSALEAFISEASDRVNPSDFETQARYEKALKSQLAGMLAAEKKSDKPRFTFDVVSGKLEMPAVVTTGWLEIKAGEVDVYQVAAYAAQVVFSGSSVDAATKKNDDPLPVLDAAPAAPLVRNEEMYRRELVRSLAPSDLPYAKSIAADLFIQQS